MRVSGYYVDTMDNHSTKTYDDASYIHSSRYRVVVMRHLVEKGERTPQMIAKSSGDGIAHISRALKELRERGLADVLVSEDRKKSRIHGVTDDGEAAYEVVEGMLDE